MTRLTPELQALVRDLKGRGFSEQVGEESLAFGDQLVLLAKEGLDIRLLSERGEWFVEAGLKSWDDWFHADVWRSCLTGSATATEPRPLPQQIDYLRDEVVTYASDQGAAADLLPCMVERRREWARRRQGRSDD